MSEMGKNKKSLLDKILAKILLPDDRRWVENHPNLYLQRLYTGCNQRAAGAWSSVVRDDSLSEYGIYGPASRLLQYPLIVLHSGSYGFNDQSLEGVDGCHHCPHYRGPKRDKNCRVDYPEECPFSVEKGDRA